MHRYLTVLSPDRLAWAAAGFIRSWLRIGKEAEHHTARAGRRVGWSPAVAADQFLLVGDEAACFFAS